MARRVPNALLNVIEYWFNICRTCVRWGSAVSVFVQLKCGVRQGGVLSPHLFAVYVDDIINKVVECDYSLKSHVVCLSIFMYADDILLISPSVTFLQCLCNIVEQELTYLEMSINAAKSVCIRIGDAYDKDCANIVLGNGNIIPWSDTCRYLGVYFKSYRVFKCVFDNAKKALFRSFNSIYGKIGCNSSVAVVFRLLSAKCLPCLLYGLNACPVNSSERKSLDFVLYRIAAKILGTSVGPVVSERRVALGLPPISDTINKIKKCFLLKYIESENNICRLFESKANNELLNITV